MRYVYTRERLSLGFGCRISNLKLTRSKYNLSLSLSLRFNPGRRCSSVSTPQYLGVRTLSTAGSNRIWNGVSQNPLHHFCFPKTVTGNGYNEGRRIVPRKMHTEMKSPTVRVTELESQIFGVLLGTIKRFNLEKTVIRVAGGWVRDKLLGKNSHDIDIALNNCTGKEFAEYVNKYLKEKGVKTNKIGVICANPDQSKHLETAKVKVLGQELDFVNLRAETYEESSRIPGMRFGTALEDALRRDFTVNGLFYNVNEGIVEDFTKRGISDMKLRIIRTPLPACETFRDDPLRIMRAIRFASRLGFELDSEIKFCARLPEILNALANKVSRERIGVELMGMLDSKAPLRALSLISDFDLTKVVFRVPLDAIPSPESDRDSGITLYKETGFEEEAVYVSCSYWLFTSHFL
uniref:Poly A polymerase head domain-containing protein n=1 Tax=Aplanochytrium stocchinoi TaxID=215587 RepID=A0A7S3PD87_9STRA